MKQKHKHYDVIVAWANGAEIECRSGGRLEWFITYAPEWNELYEYRIKPDPRAARDMAIAKAVAVAARDVFRNTGVMIDVPIEIDLTAIIASVKDES